LKPRFGSGIEEKYENNATFINIVGKKIIFLDLSRANIDRKFGQGFGVDVVIDGNELPVYVVNQMAPALKMDVYTLTISIKCSCLPVLMRNMKKNL